MNADDDMERQLDEIAETLEVTIRSLVRAHPGIEVDELAEKATSELLIDHESGEFSPTTASVVSGLTAGAALEEPELDEPDHDEPDFDAMDVDPDEDIDLETYVDLEDLITDLVYSQTFELCDQHGPLIETSDGKLLDLSHMVTNKVFTHRVGTTESEFASLAIGFDLWPLSGSGVTAMSNAGVGPTTPDPDPVSDGDRDGERDGADNGHISVTEDYYLQHWTNRRWEGAFTDGSLVAISINDEGVASVTLLDEPPPVDPEVLESFRSAYELHCEATDRPPSSDLLVAEMLLDEPTIFDEPTAPLTDYAERLGLEVRRSVAAGEPGQWHIFAAEHRLERLADWFDPSTNLATMEVVHVAEQIALGDTLGSWNPAGHVDPGDGEDPDDDATELDRVVESLSHHAVREAVSDEFFGDHEGFLPSVDPEPFLDVALDAASTEEARAAVHFMRHRMRQHRGDLQAAEAELRRAVVEDPQFNDATDRLAWFASLRGDAETAVRLWQSIPPHPETDVNLAIIERFAHAGPKPGRNEPCWCGSGKKYKKCHLGMAPIPALPERVPWLWRKAIGFVATTGITGMEQVAEVAIARAGDPGDPNAIDAAFSDPLTMDLVLSEGGYFSDFLETFGTLLPEDERHLAASWEKAHRSMHEIIEVDRAASVTLRDLRSGDLLTLTGTTFPRGAHAGRQICARAVPDGVGHQIVGGVFEVPEGEEHTVLELLDTARSHKHGAPVAEWLAGLERSRTGADDRS